MGCPAEDFSVDYEVLRPDRVLVVRLEGALTPDRLAMVGPMVQGHPEFEYDFGIIHDLSRADPGAMFSRDPSALMLAMRTGGAPRLNRVAFVLPGHLNLWPGCSCRSLAEGLGDDRRYIARSLIEALEWMHATPH